MCRKSNVISYSHQAGFIVKMRQNRKLPVYRNSQCFGDVSFGMLTKLDLLICSEKIIKKSKTHFHIISFTTYFYGPIPDHGYAEKGDVPQTRLCAVMHVY